MKNISKTEKAYQELFKAPCPRAIDHFPICMMQDWSAIIEDVSEENIILSQFIKGKTGDRELNKTLIDETISVIESKIIKHLRRTEEGLTFYKTHKKNSVRILTFCVLGCKKILKEREKKKVGISKIKSLLTNLLLVYYYLMNIDANNATIQDYEERINKRWNNKKTDLIRIEESSPETVETAFDDDSFEIGEAFSQEEEEDIVMETEPPEVLFFDFMKNLEGDPKLTKIIQKVCSTTDKHDFTAECLHDRIYNIKELRHIVKLYLRKYTKWELTPELMDKFLLCSICHLIRELTALSKFDQIDGLEVFFRYYGEIFQVDKKTLEEKKRMGLKLLQDEKEEEPDKQVPQETMTHYPLSDSETIDEAKQIFEIVAATIDYAKLSPEEIVDKRSIAKSLLGITEEENTQWIENIPKVWKKETELQQFLALVILDEFKEMEYKQISSVGKQEPTETVQDTSRLKKAIVVLTFDVKNITQEERELLITFAEKCSLCAKEITLAECDKRTTLAEETVKKSPSEIKEIWESKPELRPCLAKELLGKN